MGKLKGIEELFEGSPLRPRSIILCVRWYLRFKLSLRGGDDGRACSLAGPHDDHARGAALRAGVRQALEPLWQTGGPVLASRRKCVTNTSESLCCCIEEGSRPPEVGLQEQASNRPVLLRSKGVVVSDRGKVIHQRMAGTC